MLNEVKHLACKREIGSVKRTTPTSVPRSFASLRMTDVRLAGLWVGVLAMVVSIAQAQTNPPRAGYVYPAGGRQGDTFKIKVGGQYLATVTGVDVSGGGVQATVIEYDRPLPQPQINALNKKAQELQSQITALNAQVPQLQKQGHAAEVLAQIAAIRSQIAEIRGQIATSRRRAMSPVLAEFLILEVTIAPAAQPGERQLRLTSATGVSNPLVFCVGQLPEFTEPEPNDSPVKTPTRIALPATVNGRITPNTPDRQMKGRPGQQFTPGDVDQYQFEAHKGQQLVVAVGARQLIPYLADAVPGWFQAAVTLYDVKGKELAYDDDYRFHPDPVLHYQIPEDGEYILEIKDALYRGRDDFVYRITIGELPFVTSMFPLGGRVGSQTDIEVAGWNLPVDKTKMDATGKEPGTYPFSVLNGTMASNSMSFAVDTLPECTEKESNDSLGEAQPVDLPIIVNGRIDKSGDVDVFRFNGRAGDEIVAETMARRLDSPLDSMLKLTDATGWQLAFNDDHEDKGAGLVTHHADSYMALKLPADGTYFVWVSDTQHQGGPEYSYRLRISTPRPDFELRIVPSGISVRAAGTVPLTIYALRTDGFSGEITLSLKSAEPWFSLKGSVVPAGQDKVQVTLTAPPNPLPEPVDLSLQGSATIGGQRIVHAAVPADDMMQAFAYRHLVCAKDLKVLVADRRAGQPPRILTPLPLKIAAGSTAKVQVERLSLRFFENVRFELSDPPDGIAMQDVSIDASNSGSPYTELAFQCNAEKFKPGMKGNLIVNVSGERMPPSGDQPAPLMRRRISLGSLQAISFEITDPNA
jgi:hypothetical protein